MAIKTLHESYIKKKISPEIVTKLIFKDIDSNNPFLNAFITLLKDYSYSAAKHSSNRYQQNKSKGCLDGIPIVVKDNFCLENERTTCGSKMLMNFKPTYTATAVDKLLKNGSILIGKTNMDEFAMGSVSKDSAFGEIKNPWKDKDGQICITGGSSGGTAVSVAAGWALAGLGTDTGGSIRLPAALTGLVGFKPTYGLISRHGVISLMNALDTVSIISRTVEDAKLVFDALVGKDYHDSTNWKSRENAGGSNEGKFDISQVRIGIPEEMHPEGLDGEIVDCWDGVAGLLSNKFKCKVKKVNLPHMKYAGKCYSVLCCAEVASNMSRYDGIKYGGLNLKQKDEKTASEKETWSFDEFVAQTRSKGFGDSVRERILMGNFFMLKKNRQEYLEQAQRVWRLICSDFDEVLNPTSQSLLNSTSNQHKVDLLLTPVCLETAAPVNHFTLANDQSDNRIAMVKGDICTQPASLAGLPAITIPITLSPSRHMPIGLQLIGNKGSESLLLKVAQKIEEWANFTHKFPFVYEEAVKQAVQTGAFIDPDVQ